MLDNRMKLKQTILGFAAIAMLGGSLLSVAAPSIAVAADDKLKCTVLPQYICDASEESNPEDSATWLLIIFIIQVLTALIGFVAVGILAYAGFLYATAQNNDSQVKKAKDMILNVVIGLVLYTLMWSFAQWMIPGGVFST